jgi:hypothetical protein
MAENTDSTNEAEDVLILQSLDAYDREFPIMVNAGTEEAPSYFEERTIKVPSTDKIGPDGIRQNLIEIARADHEYLLDKYKLYKELLDKGTFRLLESKPLNYLTAAAQIANAGAEVEALTAKVTEAQALAAAKDAEIEALKAKLAGYGETNL